METSENINEISSALAKAQGQIENAIKDSSNPFFKSKYADLTSVWAACRKQLSENGLSVIQSPEESSHGISVVTMLCHSSGQWIRSKYSMPCDSSKLTPQVIGSAITYARRYALSAMVGIAPHDDDDGNEASNKPANNVEKPKQFLTPDNKSEWERAVNSFKKNGNLKNVLEQRQVSKEHQEQIINEAKAEDVPQ